MLAKHIIAATRTPESELLASAMEKLKNPEWLKANPDIVAYIRRKNARLAQALHK